MLFKKMISLQEQKRDVMRGALCATTDRERLRQLRHDTGAKRGALRSGGGGSAAAGIRSGARPQAIARAACAASCVVRTSALSTGWPSTCVSLLQNTAGGAAVTPNRGVEYDQQRLRGWLFRGMRADADAYFAAAEHDTRLAGSVFDKEWGMSTTFILCSFGVAPQQARHALSRSCGVL